MWTRKRNAPAQRIWCFCDGSTGALSEQRAGPNRSVADAPLTCAAAAVAHDDDGQIVDWAWETLPALTNNEAEYAGLILGLKLAQRLRAREVICVLDSEVVVGQMEGRFGVHSQRLREWHWKACAAARAVPIVRYRLVPREWNRLADGLAGQASLPWAALRRVVGEVVS